MGKVSGNYNDDDRDDEKPQRKSSTRARKLAEELSIREVGNLDVVDQHIAQAEGIIAWEDLEVVLKREGWVADGSWNYPNENDSAILYTAHKYVYWKMRKKKKFLLSHLDGDGRKVHGAGPVRVAYNLPELLERDDEDIECVEGEKGVEICKALGFLATCIQGQNWTDEAASPFYGRNVNVAMDNDDAGRESTKKAIEQLIKAGARIVRVPLLPDLGPRQGLDDWLKNHTVEEYREITGRTIPVYKELNVEPYNFPAEKDILTYDWLHRAHLIRDEASGTAATGGTGKSNLSIIEALEMTTGKRLLYGSGNGRKLRVVLINLEDNRNTMEKRIAAAMKHYELTPDDVGRRLIVIAKGEIKIKIARQEGREVVRNESDIRKLINIMIKNRGDVLSVDSFVRSHKVNENDNSAVTEVVECYEEVATGANCAVHNWHHNRKSNGEEATVKSSRGAQAFVDAHRSVRILEKMTKKQRDDLLVAVPDMAEAGWYFREFNGKRNFAPPAEESNWYRYVNIELDNAKDFMTSGDHVGVATAWVYPKLDTSAAKSPIGKEAALSAIAAGGPWRKNHASEGEPWVGVPIAAGLGWNLDDPRAKSTVLKLVKEWLGTGLLKEVEGRDGNRKPKIYIERGKTEKT